MLQRDLLNHVKRAQTFRAFRENSHAILTRSPRERDVWTSADNSRSKESLERREREHGTTRSSIMQNHSANLFSKHRRGFMSFFFLTVQIGTSW
ncbi:Hypothetical protein NTJ_01474 [Nesidiocoris tenuis]|uniref:Uncharacterized protein n=1 Tax=Nesidiocoris tenuis TaxID=355587 RepID=A0ABN7ABR6_9HEMI|nr:Hypothetical protein NTJ_01474 [Nesidiocoris tenuis]